MNQLLRKKIYALFTSILCCSLLVVSCSDNPSGIDPVDLTVRVSFSEGYDTPSVAGAEMTLTNVNSQETYDATVDASGEAVFLELPSGNYDIAVVLTLSQQEVFELTGNYPESAEVVFNGSLNNILINPEAESPEVELTTGKLGDLVIKQVYYAGSDIVDGAIFRDQFIEIYNNSNETIDVSGLYIMGAYGNRSQEGTSIETETGQFDWNQSIGMPADIDANEDYLYARWLYRVPTDSEKMLDPGESIVIAQTALNHKQPFTDLEGEPVSVNDPSLTVDLSTADYEVYLGDDVENVYPSDINNPDVPNLENIYIFGRDLILDAPGRDAYVIFRTEVDPGDFEAYPDPEEEVINSGTDFYPQIPTEWVIDAVQIQGSPANQVPKLLQNKLDAGYTYVPGGSFSSNSVIRIAAKQSGGRVILRDTNNSETDFTYLEYAEPRAQAPQSSNPAKFFARSATPEQQKYLQFIDQLESQWAPGIYR